MANWKEYTTKTIPEDADEIMIADSKANVSKRTPFSGLWNWIANKLATAVISQLETQNKSIIPALNELNSNKGLQRLYINERVTNSKELSYTGVKIEIPSNTNAIIQFESTYIKGKPIKTVVSNSDTTSSDANILTSADYPQKCFLMHQSQGKATTYYVWASYSSISDNSVKVMAFLFPE